VMWHTERIVFGKLAAPTELHPKHNPDTIGTRSVFTPLLILLLTYRPLPHPDGWQECTPVLAKQISSQPQMKPADMLILLTSCKAVPVSYLNVNTKIAKILKFRRFFRIKSCKFVTNKGLR